MMTTTTIELDLTEQEFGKLQELFASISMTVDEFATCLLKAVVDREEEILSRFQNGEPAEKILEEVSGDTLKELFGGQDGE